MGTEKKRKPPVRGLEGVVAAETRLCYVDGQNGKLYYCGYDIDELAGRVCYEEIVHMLWGGGLPDLDTLEDWRPQLVAEMRLPAQVVDILNIAPPGANPMVVLRTAVSALGLWDPDGGRNTLRANERKARRILAQVATIVAAIYRQRRGEPIITPDKSLGFAANFLYMFHGTVPSKLDQSIFDTLLMLHADHGLAASTFAARATVSTLAGMHSAIAAALASLKGPLHGGANTKVMEMLEDIGDAKRVKAYIDGMLAGGHRIMGFGHRVYKTEDPRSRHLRRFSKKLSKRAKTRDLFEMSNQIEQLVLEGKGICPNVDFYSATVQEALGIPKEYFTCIFAVARTAGWIAHVLEQFTDNRLIRPTSTYIGGFGKRFVPVAKR